MIPTRRHAPVLSWCESASATNNLTVRRPTASTAKGSSKSPAFLRRPLALTHAHFATFVCVGAAKSQDQVQISWQAQRVRNVRYKLSGQVQRVRKVWKNSVASAALEIEE